MQRPRLMQSLAQLSGTVVLVLALVLFQGCIPIPIPNPEVTYGTRINSEELAFIEAGVTTETEVTQKLGEPSVSFRFRNRGKVMVYEWEELDWYYLYGMLAPAPIFYLAGVGKLFGENALFVGLDTQHYVMRFEFSESHWFGGIAPWEERPLVFREDSARIYRPGPRLSLRPRAIEWVEEGDIHKVTSSPGKFEQQTIPPGMSVIYFYGADGFPSHDALTLEVKPSDYDSGYEILGTVQPGEYMAVTVAPSEHTFSLKYPLGPVVPLEATITIQALPDTASYIEIGGIEQSPNRFQRTPKRYDRAMLQKLFMERRSQGEALPILAELKPSLFTRLTNP